MSISISNLSSLSHVIFQVLSKKDNKLQSDYTVTKKFSLSHHVFHHAHDTVKPCLICTGAAWEISEKNYKDKVFFRIRASGLSHYGFSDILDDPLVFYKVGTEVPKRSRRRNLCDVRFDIGWLMITWFIHTPQLDFVITTPRVLLTELQLGCPTHGMLQNRSGRFKTPLDQGHYLSCSSQLSKIMLSFSTIRPCTGGEEFLVGVGINKQEKGGPQLDNTSKSLQERKKKYRF